MSQLEQKRIEGDDALTVMGSFIEKKLPDLQKQISDEIAGNIDSLVSLNVDGKSPEYVEGKAPEGYVATFISHTGKDRDPRILSSNQGSRISVPHTSLDGK